MKFDTSLTMIQCNSIHKTIVESFKHAIVYGKSCKHQPQRVGLTHELADEDIGMYITSRQCMSGGQVTDALASYHCQTIDVVL